VDWDAGIWRYRSNDNIVEIIKDNYIVLNLRENNLFVLIFFREIEEGNNSFDINIDNFFIRVFIISPLLSEYGEYTNIFSESKVR